MNFILFTIAELETIVNPYYAIGELHNQGLDYAIDNLPASPTRKDIVNVVSDYMLSISSDSSAIQGAAYKVFLSDLMNKSDCCKGIDLHDFDTDQRRYLGLLLNPPTDTAAADLPVYYVKQENDIHNSILTAEQKKLPMLGVAIARESSAYWNAQVTAGVASPWNSILVASGGALAIPRIVSADFWGAVKGAISGALDSWLHGGDVVEGAKKGAVSGAITASLKAAFGR